MLISWIHPVAPGIGRHCTADIPTLGIKIQYEWIVVLPKIEMLNATVLTTFSAM
jgi:hypothetical protein